MNKLFINLFAVAAVAVVCYASSPYKQCKGVEFDDLENRIKVDPCGSSKCKLRKGTNTTVSFRFITTAPVADLTNDVFARLGGFELPFLGVTATSACEDVKRADTGADAPCPLQAGLEYVYENSFYIYPIYPESELTVHWSLNSGDTKVICFEVPAAIVPAKKH